MQERGKEERVRSIRVTAARSSHAQIVLFQPMTIGSYCPLVLIPPRRSKYQNTSRLASDRCRSWDGVGLPTTVRVAHSVVNVDKNAGIIGLVSSGEANEVEPTLVPQPVTRILFS